MKSCLYLAALLVFLSGCWRGGLVKQDQIAYRHDAVLWVYEAGGQVGRYGIFAMPVENMILDLQPGKDRVVVTEGQEGGQCTAAPQASGRLTHSLDTRTGRSVLGTGVAQRLHYPFAQHERRPQDRWTMALDDGLAVGAQVPHGPLLLDTATGQVELLRVEDPGSHNERWLGQPVAAFRTEDDVLIVGLAQGFVVAVDLKRLQGSTALPASGPE